MSQDNKAKAANITVSIATCIGRVQWCLAHIQRIHDPVLVEKANAAITALRAMNEHIFNKLEE